MICIGCFVKDDHFKRILLILRNSTSRSGGFISKQGISFPKRGWNFFLFRNNVLISQGKLFNFFCRIEKKNKKIIKPALTFQTSVEQLKVKLIENTII